MLLTFSSTGALPLSKIGERLQVHATSVTNVIDRLEASGFVRREPNPRDGRGTLAVITDSGRHGGRPGHPRAAPQPVRPAGPAPDELRQLFSILRRLRVDAGDFVD